MGLKRFISDDQLEPVVQKIRNDLPTVLGKNLDDQIEGLLYINASNFVQLVHERNYNAIFGSQLTLLGRMNSGPVREGIAKEIYDRAKMASPEPYRDFTFEQWIAFLHSAGLIGTEPNGSYALTTFGRGFYEISRR